MKENHGFTEKGKKDSILFSNRIIDSNPEKASNSKEISTLKNQGYDIEHKSRTQDATTTNVKSRLGLKKRQHCHEILRKTALI